MRDIRGNGLPRATRAPKVTHRHRDHAVGGLYRKSRRQPSTQEERSVRRANHAATPRRAAIVSDDVEIHPLVQRAKFLSKHGHVTPGRHGL